MNLNEIRRMQQLAGIVNEGAYDGEAGADIVAESDTTDETHIMFRNLAAIIKNSRLMSIAKFDIHSEEDDGYIPLNIVGAMRIGGNQFTVDIVYGSDGGWSLSLGEGEGVYGGALVGNGSDKLLGALGALSEITDEQMTKLILSHVGAVTGIKFSS